VTLCAFYTSFPNSFFPSPLFNTALGLEFPLLPFTPQWILTTRWQCACKQKRTSVGTPPQEVPGAMVVAVNDDDR
jgi:hypothetical protein